MTNSEIESFLAVCRYQTVSRAAEALYITQSSLSTRLKTLERELGGQLFFRRKGSRKMTLTTGGRRFYEMAVQYEALVKQMKQVCRETPECLRVSSLNSIDTFLMPAVYEHFLQKCPDIKLEIQDMERQAASESILNGMTDLAFTSGKNTNVRLKQTLAFIEPMVLIYSGTEFTEPVQQKQLSLRNEVYIEWSTQFAQWHQQLFGEVHPQISISIMPHLQQFLERKNYWAFVPISVAIGLEKVCPIRQLTTVFPIPPREVSILSPADEEDNTAVIAFCRCLREALAAYPEIKTIL